jgi:uncharacterized protein (DUF697 family)
MTPDVSKTVHRTTLATSVIAVILSPIPLADELVFLPMYGVLASKIGRAHGLTLGKIPWKPVMKTAMAALAARAAVNVGVSYIPGVAAVANAITAAALTEFFGRYVDTTCADPGAAQTLTMKQVLETLRRELGDRLGGMFAKAKPAA